MIFATMIPILISVVPTTERGRALGITTAAVYFGLSAGPFLGGFITQQLGWRFIFWLNLPLGLILLAVTFLLLKGDWAEAHGEKFDLAGSALLGISLIAAMYGFSTLPSLTSGLTALAGLIGIIFFVLFEKRVLHPIVNIDLFRRNTVFAFSNLAALISYAATFAVGFLLSLYLQKVKALSPQAAGLILVAQPFVQAVFSPLTGRLSDKHEPRTLASLGMIGTLLGLIMLAFLGTATPLWYIVICLIILGLGFALFSSPNTNAIMSSVERPVYGVASATLSTMRQMGMMFSMGTVMMAISLLMGKADIGPDNTGQFLLSMRISFILFAVLSFGGIFASLARGKMNRANESN
jgi:MFS family permease